MTSLPFLEDIYPDNFLYGILIRSPAAKGSLKYIQTPKLPDNYELITARNIPGENIFGKTCMPVFADSIVSYIGEPVGLLVGPEKTRLENIASDCAVITDSETPCFSGMESSFFLSREITVSGSVKETGSEELTLTSSYSTGIQEHWYAEPNGAITWYSEDKDEKKRKKENIQVSRSIVVKTATQHPNHVMNCVSRVLGIDPSLVTVLPTALSLHMDGKLWYPSLISCHAAIGTFITKRPVRLILDREEDFFFSPKRCASNINITSKINKNGKINSVNIDLSVNLGAYEVNGNEIIDQMCIGVLGNYKIDNIHINAKALKSNLPPQGPFCGFGLAQGLFAIERHISLIADSVNNDPLLLRKENIFPNTGLFSKIEEFLKENKTDLQITLADEKHKTTPAEEEALILLLDNAAKLSDYKRKWTAYELLRQSNKDINPERNESPRGIGISLGFQGNGLIHDSGDTYSVEVTLTKESILEIKTNISSSEDFGKIWEKIAIETVSIQPDMVKIISEVPHNCGPSCTSRNITLVTKLVEKCCIAIRKQRFRSPLPITVRRSQRGSSPSFLKPGAACAVVEVSIDTTECVPNIRGVWLVIDGGKIISVNRARRSLIRGAVQALGWAYTEKIEYKDGHLSLDQYKNFSIPSPAEIPPVHINFINNEKHETKGIGDLPFSCIPSAFLQAVTQAMNHTYKNIPLKSHDIWEMIKQRKQNDH